MTARELQQVSTEEFVQSPFTWPMLLAVELQQNFVSYTSLFHCLVNSHVLLLSWRCWDFGDTQQTLEFTIIASMWNFSTPVSDGSSFPSQCNTNSWQSFSLNLCCISFCLSSKSSYPQSLNLLKALQRSAISWQVFSSTHERFCSSH